MVALMSRVPLTLRMLVLLPLLATGVDLTRATLACGPDAQLCLQAAGQGWLGSAAVGLVPLYALGLALVLARTARGLGAATAGTRPSFARLWLLGSAGVGAVCTGQIALAQQLGSGAPLGGSPLWTALLCLAAGALLALAMRAADAVGELRPAAPRVRLSDCRTLVLVAEAPRSRAHRFASRLRGRAPPSA
jgi:hypothetical protein